MKYQHFLTALFLNCAAISWADLYTAVPFQEYTDYRAQVFQFFDSLVSYEGYLVAGDGQYLGKISRSRFSLSSINNEFASYGSSYSKYSIFNPSGTYGSQFSDFSPFNAYALNPPTIRYVQNGVEYVAGTLTRNAYYAGPYAVPNIDPNCLHDWLKAIERCR